MPLPQFLLMIVAVVLAAAATLWFSLANGVPVVGLALAALIAAAVLRFTRDDHRL
ncbi:hypothetical protein [Paracoccus aerodenitrificans]|uniref:hypothetical protein n=1 Tax=Paracoccus aerodenitrificans TaxID=3017781 RepID=UPI0022F11EBC|nr:hypothetical protein [Paracoccus aerodenitrificans]WBU64602.1 hypothetical protein PAE61_03920 [Paracoccus aerodenitrificans]